MAQRIIQIKTSDPEEVNTILKHRYWANKKYNRWLFAWIVQGIGLLLILEIFNPMWLISYALFITWVLPPILYSKHHYKAFKRFKEYQQWAKE